MRWIALFLSAVGIASGAERVLVLSLDGMGYQIFTQEPFSQRMRALRSRLRHGVILPMQPAFPSTTANGHVALATGRWGNVNGVPANAHPPLPRSAHSSRERVNGFDTVNLASEPFWETAARQGIPSAAINFVATAPRLRPGAPPIPGLAALNHYQSIQALPHRLLNPDDVVFDDRCPARTCFHWTEAGVRFQGEMGPRSAIIRAQGSAVKVREHPVESTGAGRRKLARFFSEGLRLATPVEGMVYFRLFRAGHNFELFRSSLSELAISNGDGNPAILRRAILSEAGGVVSGMPRDPLAADEELALARALEVNELLVRQQGLLHEWIWRRTGAKLVAGYLSQPDSALHSWYGLAQRDRRYREALAAAFEALDRSLEALLAHIGKDDHGIVVSDHGMGVTKWLAPVGTPLAEAGLSDAVSYLYNCIVVDTEDWKDGTVPLAARATAVDRARSALEAWRNPSTGKPLVHAFFTPERDETALGIGGANGGDLCFDPAPGVYFLAGTGPVRAAIPWTGNHGGHPLRPELQSLFGAFGPRLRAWSPRRPMRAIDVAELVALLLQFAWPPSERGTR